MTVVLDSSAVLASLLNEPGKSEVDTHWGDAIMSTVNLAEVVSYFSKMGSSQDDVRAILEALPIGFTSPDESIAIAAGNLRASTQKAGLSLGDRFCLALALQNDMVALTSDQKWSDVADEIGVKVKQVR